MSEAVPDAKEKFDLWLRTRPLSIAITELIQVALPITISYDTLFLIGNSEAPLETLPEIPQECLDALTLLEVDIFSIQFKGVFWETLERMSRAQPGVWKLNE